ncbi:MAG: ABC transporter ATP-binding protein [Chloroflexota bacterium]|nr:ABC transporter ATP-binding protein [Chloroflexota bacterium]MDE2942457.1 ABC transporter ATP-binding protein [Chloroflexota bacterium]MDE3267863.1 ABC transporter ATP-binding protein [Chloroflexota bacterium]
MYILVRLLRYALKYKFRLALAYVSTIGVTAFALAIPYVLGKGVDKVLESLVLSELYPYALVIFALSVGRGVAAYGQQYLGESLGQRVAYDMRNAYYEKLQRLSFAFHDSQRSGDLMSRATADVEGVRMFIQGGVVRGGFMILLILGVSVILVVSSWKLALMSLVFVPFIILRTSTIMLTMRRNWLAERTEMGHLNTVLQENLAGQRVVRAFAAEDLEKEKFGYRAGEVAKYGFNAERLQAVTTSLNNFFFLGGTGVILWFGGRQVVEGSMTAGVLVSFLLYMGLLAIPVRMTAWIVNSFSRAISSGERIYYVLDAESPVSEKPGAIELPRVRGNVRFDNVSFGYEESTPVLRDVNIEVPSTKILAILGAPGSGKSTIVHLIPRFYDVTGGRITVDGVDVRDVTLSSLRHNVGLVQQDVFIFTSTIRANIAYGAVHASEEEVIKAAKLAQLHDFIESLPEGYDTYVGERGVTLSGGQRQRLAIARTLLLDPPILILDDSTSSVDTQTEHLIRQALITVMQGRTTFVIAHRLSSVRNADSILVMKDGQVVQLGTHEELVNIPGPYQEIYELQLRPQEPEVNGHQEEAVKAITGEASESGSTAAIESVRKPGSTQREAQP